MMMLTSATASAAAGTITTITLVLIALGMVCAIAVIAWGAGRRRAKSHEIADSEEHAALAGHAPVPEVVPEPVSSDLPLEPSVLAMAPPVVPEVIAPPEAAVAPTSITETVDNAETPDRTIDEARSVTLLKGLGPKAATRLNELGITSVGQLAKLSPAEIDAIDVQMGSFTGRITRDRWIEQARLLAAGDIKGFEATFGKLGG